MRLVFVSEARFERCQDGKVYSPDGTFSLNLWNRYLSYYDKILVIGRVVNIEHSGYDNKLLAESNDVSFIDIPYYIGLYEFLKRIISIRRVIKGVCHTNQAYICRVPGILGSMVAKELAAKSIPYAVEVVGDPWDVFSKESINHPLRPFIKISSTLLLKKVVKKAAAALYVTQDMLQNRYPCNIRVFSTNASNVILKDSLVNSISKKCEDKEMYNFISVGSLAQMYKAPDICIDAIKILKEKNVNCSLTWLGGGTYLERMINYAKEQDVAEHCNFIGAVAAGEEVRAHLGLTDCFILASKTEGLPRAMIEAMATGLPCIGTNVGGIPELLDEIAIIEPNNAHALADKIIQFLHNKELMNNQASRNLQESKKYCESVLNKRREMFYKEIIRISNNESV